jgi:signal transduction histidine kinase
LALPTLAREVLIELQARYPGAAGVRLDFDPAFPLLALDAARMRLLLRNLLDNALRYSSQAPLAPEVHGSVGARHITLAVRDHGPGVPECDLHRLAEPFYRPDAARTRAQGGVGLGLHLCKLVTLAHGGTFSVVNATPGLLVTVVLPLPL